MRGLRPPFETVGGNNVVQPSSAASLPNTERRVDRGTKLEVVA